MTLCPTCNKPEMVYGPHTELECRLNQFQAKVDERHLRFTPLNNDMRQLLASNGAVAEQFSCPVPNGKFTGTFVSRPILEGISMYRDTGVDYMTLSEYLTALGVTE